MVKFKNWEGCNGSASGKIIRWVQILQFVIQYQCHFVNPNEVQALQESRSYSDICRVKGIQVEQGNVVYRPIYRQQQQHLIGSNYKR
jgi:hypothetical protein